MCSSVLIISSRVLRQLMNVLALMGLEMMMIWSSLMMGETTIVHPMILCSSMCMLLD